MIRSGHRVQFSLLSSVHSLFFIYCFRQSISFRTIFCFYYWFTFPSIFCFALKFSFPNNKLPDWLLTRYLWRKISNGILYIFVWTFFSIVLWFESAMNLWSFEYNFAFSLKKKMKTVLANDHGIFTTLLPCYK